jgi:hypothetical protein
MTIASSPGCSAAKTRGKEIQYHEALKGRYKNRVQAHAYAWATDTENTRETRIPQGGSCHRARREHRDIHLGFFILPRPRLYQLSTLPARYLLFFDFVS